MSASEINTISRFIFDQTVYYLQLYWKKESFDLNLTNGKHIWKGQGLKSAFSNE